MAIRVQAMGQPNYEHGCKVSLQEHMVELARKRRGITPSTALRLSRYFGMSPDF
jgi:hypothetical protein